MPNMPDIAQCRIAFVRNDTMTRTIAFVALLATTVPVAADPPIGSYRLSADLGEGWSFTVLLSFTQQQNGWTGQYLGSIDLAPELRPAVKDVRIDGERIRFSLAFSPSQVITFDGRLPTGRKSIPGSLAVGSTLTPTVLEPSALQKFDRVEMLKEMVLTSGPSPAFYNAAIDLLRAATSAKATPADVKSWTDRVTAAAEVNGVRWQLVVLLRMSRALADQPTYLANALELIRQADRLLTPTEDFGLQFLVLEQLQQLLRKSNDTAGVASIQTRIDALEARDFLEYLAAYPLKPAPFAGRKVKSDRAVLVELFTGADCPASVAAILAFDTLGKSYTTQEVVRLQYHLHTPSPDPLTARVSETRWHYYAARIDKASAATPSLFINGKLDPNGGGPAETSSVRLKQYRAAIDPFLDKAPGATLQLDVKQNSDKLAIVTKVTGLARPSDKIRLRIAIAEPLVRYRGGNGVRYHQCVVRGFAGSPDGFAMARTANELQLSVDLSEIRTSLNRELDEFEKRAQDGVFAARPLDLRKLLVVAFVQDDTTAEVLQAAQIEVK